MVICECILSDETLNHVKILQKILHRDSDFQSRSQAIGLMIKYVVSDLDGISLDDLILLDDYFFSHPSFLYGFYNDVMMSATFHPYCYSN